YHGRLYRFPHTLHTGNHPIYITLNRFLVFSVHLCVNSCRTGFCFQPLTLMAGKGYCSLADMLWWVKCFLSYTKIYAGPVQFPNGAFLPQPFDFFFKDLYNPFNVLAGCPPSQAKSYRGFSVRLG